MIARYMYRKECEIHKRALRDYNKLVTFKDKQ